MKTIIRRKYQWEQAWLWAVVITVASLLRTGAEPVAVEETAADVAAAADFEVNKEVTITRNDADEPGKAEVDVVLKTLKPVSLEAKGLPPKEVTWLGIHTEEAPEVIAAQLELAHGGGLVIQYVTPESPAAKVGLQKNDVLAQWEDQWLVHPEQLRKLVQARKEGDTVALKYYRGGKINPVSVVLGKSRAGEWNLPGGEDGQEFWKVLRNADHWSALPQGHELRVQMDKVKESMGRIKIDEKKLKNEIQRSMESAQKALSEALGRMTNVEPALETARKDLEKLSKSTIAVSQDARVTVKSGKGGVQSIVQADEEGTYVIVANPKKRLTAHDKQGSLVFDGEIETPEQRSQLPEELKAKVDAMLDGMKSR